MHHTLENRQIIIKSRTLKVHSKCICTLNKQNHLCITCLPLIGQRLNVTYFCAHGLAESVEFMFALDFPRFLVGFVRGDETRFVAVMGCLKLGHLEKGEVGEWKIKLSAIL